MYEIIEKKELNKTVTFMSIKAPFVARKALAGQFIILRVDADGERIPLTIAGYDRVNGTVDIIFQVVGGTTLALNKMCVGDCLQDFVGPLGNATHTKGIKKVCIVGGGVGCAIAYPVAKAFCDEGAHVTSIVGFRSKDLVVLEDEFDKASNRFIKVSDDGSWGEQGLVTAPLKKMLDDGEQFDMIITIGPLIMMKFVVETARPYNVPITASMNPIMIDGTGMCGGCRLSVGGKVKFACVDGPEFNGYEIDFDDAMNRNRSYAEFERKAHSDECNLMNKEVL